MGEEFHGGVYGGAWCKPSLFFGGGGFSSWPCSVAQLGGGYDMGSFAWPQETMKGKSYNQVCEDNNNNNNNLVFLDCFDSTLDILGFGLSPTCSTTDWNQQNQFYKGEINEESHESILVQDDIGSNNIPIAMINSTTFPSQDDGPPPTTITTTRMTTTATSSSSNSSGDSSTIITSKGGPTMNFSMSSSSSYYLIPTLFDDNIDESQVPLQQSTSHLFDPNNFGSMDSQVSNFLPTSIELLPQEGDKFDGGELYNNCDYNTVTNLSNFRACLLNSLKSRSRAPTFNQKSLNCANHLTAKLKHEVVRQESKQNMNNDQPLAKRPRIETPSLLPTFKVRKEKLGDRITALQQLVSPFGKTDTASVLHEAIEYIKFLHTQVHVLSKPYMKSEAPVQNQRFSDGNKENEEQDLQSRGLCLVPISSTYPIRQETSVDFWTPTFGGTTFR